MTYPTISVITVVFNNVSSINETIESVLNQDYPQIEYIVIDGGSNDGTVDVIKRHATEIAYWGSESDKGIYDAMNKGIDRATGEWIIFMNSGDCFISHHTLTSVFNQNPDADILYGDAIVQYPSFETLYPKIPLESMWRKMPFCHQATLVRATIMKAYKFNLKYSLSSDYNFLYKAYRAGLNFKYINETICRFNYTSGASRNNALRSIEERKQIVLLENFDLIKWTYYFTLKLYIKLSIVTKNVFGNKFTEWVTKRLRA